MDTPDTTEALRRKLQSKHRDLKKESKFDQKTYRNIYPSGSTTPSANRTINAHKASKDYPARLITSHIGAPQEHVPTLFNDILKLFIEKIPHVCKNSLNL